MSFFDKFKAGMNDAGNKAKTLVEINKLKLQNHNKKNEIDKQLLEIGRAVYTVNEADQWPPDQESIQPYVRQIRQLKQEIEQNQLQILNLTEEKVCRECGHHAAVNATTCSHCGHVFQVIQVTAEPNDEETKEARFLPDGNEPEERK
ncbi:hypothetical protein JCM10914A_34530 [Paenibacillus sp. JCM 10914]|uniref:zinc ribbon domain-containing protein n=1 Tax=Paenibacillus sp. JCM 10914 TaxID=1236974 RepID=UPI0003CC877C|nr:zinc ribbon domain-containing protein [Paenibacillus sp. JCM 10914]GAE04084.1 hypothetical protein JCM10914_109 [Paenibacillus sp. JCM 10914]